MEEQVVAIFAGVNGYVDSVDTNQVVRYEKALMTAIRERGTDILIAIRDEKEISDATSEKLKTFLEDFTSSFE